MKLYIERIFTQAGISFDGEDDSAEDTSSFAAICCDRIYEIYQKTDKKQRRYPVCLILARDTDNYIDDLIHSIEYLHQETEDLIDLFLIGWAGDNNPFFGLRFDQQLFFNSRRNLSKVIGEEFYEGVLKLLLVDVYIDTNEEVYIDFRNSLPIDLHKLISDGYLATPSQFIQIIVNLLKDTKNKKHFIPSVYGISDALGLKAGLSSFLEYMLKKLGEPIKAELLKQYAIRKYQGEPIKISQKRGENSDEKD